MFASKSSIFSIVFIESYYITVILAYYYRVDIIIEMELNYCYVTIFLKNEITGHFVANISQFHREEMKER